MDDPFPSLTDFRRGFADGFHNQPRDRTGSPVYTHAYKAGTEARKRDNEYREGAK